MAFTSLKLKPASGANRIKNADDAYSFMMHMRLSDQNKPHWQVAKYVAETDGGAAGAGVRASIDETQDQNLHAIMAIIEEGK